MPIRASILVLLGVAFLAAAPPLARGELQVQPGIGFVALTGASPGVEVVLQDRRQHEVARGTTDRFGSLLFRELVPGGRYIVRASDSPDATPVTVLEFADHPDPPFYGRQVLHEGLQYIEARDGTLLAAMVRPPLGMSLADGPFPTVVEYSGYAAADPDSPQPSTLIASVLGFATVGVNMRGSGCSGGVFDLFDLPTTADGYDIVETVAAQPWVLAGRVGMVGISFPGISQLFVGGARPPHLAAIAPLSVTEHPGFPAASSTTASPRPGFRSGPTMPSRRRKADRPGPLNVSTRVTRRASRTSGSVCRRRTRSRPPGHFASTCRG